VISMHVLDKHTCMYYITQNRIRVQKLRIQTRAGTGKPGEFWIGLRQQVGQLMHHVA